MARIMLVFIGVVTRGVGVLLTPASVSGDDERAPFTVRSLITQRIERLPDGPLCWNGFELALPVGGRSPASDNHAHPIAVGYRAEGTHRVEYAGGPVLT